MYTAGITAAAAHPQQAQNLIDLLTGAAQHEQRKRAGFISARSQVRT
jgi:molybdate transport system substrate-binding protein